MKSFRMSNLIDMYETTSSPALWSALMFYAHHTIVWNIKADESAVDEAVYETLGRI